MAVTNEQILGFLTANPDLTDAQIVAAMEQYGVSPAQMASAVGIPEGEVAARVAATVPPGQTITLGDTIVQPQYQITGSGENQEIGGIENVLTYKVSDNQVGGGYTQYTPTGEVERTGTQQKVGNLAGEALLGSALLFGGLGGGFDGLFGGGGAATGGTAFDLANAGIMGGTAAFTPAELAAISGGTAAGLGGTTGLLTAGTGLGTGVLTGSNLGTALAGVGSALGTGLKTSNLANLFSGGLGTTGSLLQMQQSKEAAQRAQQMIDAETAAAKQAAQFRPVGMTTRFGTSQFTVDPVTGQLTSAGYTLSPEAKNAQDRLVKLAEQGLQQAEGAQQQFAPLQTGAQNLFNLGNQYIAQSPQEVAQNYLNQQMALLQPGRELELANLQNKLQQQGRGGLAVAQGGALGATTPELQALYNARAQQEAQLAANAQQFGQQNVQFGAGLLGTGAQTMGNYYAGQQAAYAPYTTALGQVQGLEAAAQQPLTTGINLGQISSQAGANVGRLGLTGAQLSTNMATSANATANPYAQALMAAGNPNAMFGQALGNVFGGLFS